MTFFGLPDERPRTLDKKKETVETAKFKSDTTSTTEKNQNAAKEIQVWWGILLRGEVLCVIRIALVEIPYQNCVIKFALFVVPISITNDKAR